MIRTSRHEVTGMVNVMGNYPKAAELFRLMNSCWFRTMFANQKLRILRIGSKPWLSNDFNGCSKLRSQKWVLSSDSWNPLWTWRGIRTEYLAKMGSWSVGFWANSVAICCVSPSCQSQCILSHLVVRRSRTRCRRLQRKFGPRRMGRVGLSWISLPVMGEGPRVFFPSFLPFRYWESLG